MATRSSWKNLPLPQQRATLRVDLCFNADEFAKLAAGQVPEAMEDKWFIFLEEPWLHLHRSWTGFCIYQVRIESQNDGHRVTEVLVNRDTTQYREQSDEQDVLLLSVLLCGRAGRDSKQLWERYTSHLHRSRPDGR